MYGDGMFSTTKAAVMALPFSVSLTVAVAPSPDWVGPGIGVGFKPCSEYNSHIRSNGAYREQDKAWVFGFITGYNVFARKPKAASLFMSYDADSIIRQIDKQCFDNPNALLVDEVSKFIYALMGRADAGGSREER